MTELEFLEIINDEISELIIQVILLSIVSLFYYRRKVAAYQVATLVSLQFLMDTLLIPIFTEYQLGYLWSYFFCSITATYVTINLFFRAYNNQLKITLVEYSVVTLELFIVLCMTCRFIDKFLLAGSNFSDIYMIITEGAYFLIILSLLLPALSIATHKLGLDDFIEKTGIKPVFANVLNFDIARLFAKRG